MPVSRRLSEATEQPTVMLSPHPRKPSIGHAVVITMAPLNRLGRYRRYLGAQLLVASTRMPLLDAACKLIRLGANPDAIVAMRHTGAGHDALRARLGPAAGVPLDEDRCRFQPVRRGGYGPTRESNSPGLCRRPSDQPRRGGREDGIHPAAELHALGENIKADGPSRSCPGTRDYSHPTDPNQGLVRRAESPAPEFRVSVHRSQ